LGIPLAALDAELEALGIRRKAYRIARGTGAQMPLAKAAAGPGGAPVRRRTRTPAPPRRQTRKTEEPFRATNPEGPARRGRPSPRPVGERLGVSGGPARAPARAGLEREFALRERT